MEETPAKKQIEAIKGTKDILPREAGEWQRVEGVTKGIFELYGYRELRAPVFEATELFERGTGQTSDVVIKEMYTFKDKAGRSLTLRPEYTPSVVRSIIENRLYLQPEPMRYYYIGPMFRYDKPQKGRYRQFHQVDIEVFGEKDDILNLMHAVMDSVTDRLCSPRLIGKVIHDVGICTPRQAVFFWNIFILRICVAHVAIFARHFGFVRNDNGSMVAVYPNFLDVVMVNVVANIDPAQDLVVVRSVLYAAKRVTARHWIEVFNLFIGVVFKVLRGTRILVSMIACSVVDKRLTGLNHSLSRSLHVGDQDVRPSGFGGV